MDVPGRQMRMQRQLVASGKTEVKYLGLFVINPDNGVKMRLHMVLEWSDEPQGQAHIAAFLSLGELRSVPPPVKSTQPTLSDVRQFPEATTGAGREGSVPTAPPAILVTRHQSELTQIKHQELRS
jgi:hypothetical protein